MKYETAKAIVAEVHPTITIHEPQPEHPPGVIMISKEPDTTQVMFPLPIYLLDDKTEDEKAAAERDFLLGNINAMMKGHAEVWAAKHVEPPKPELVVTEAAAPLPNQDSAAQGVNASTQSPGEDRG